MTLYRTFQNLPAHAPPAPTKLRALFKPEYQHVEVKPLHSRYGHRYEVDGAVLTSVTTALGVIHKPPLVKWAKNTALAKAQKLLIDADLADPTTRESVISDAIERASEEDFTARDAGLRMHELIQAALVDGVAVAGDDDAAYSAREAILWFRQNIADAIAVEEPIWAPASGFAGTVDFIGRDHWGGLVVGDWKRSARVYIEHGAQVAAYSLALGELLQTRGRIRPVVVRPARHADEQTIMREVRADARDALASVFLSALRLSNRLEEIKKAEFSRQIWEGE